MRALFVTFNDIRSQSPRYRAFWPAEALRRTGAEARCLVWRDVRRSDIEWADITVFARAVNAAARAWFPSRVLARLGEMAAAARRRGPVLAELDDLVFVQGHDRGRPRLVPWHESHLAASDCLLTTTAPLADALSALNPRVAVIPNCIDADSLRPGHPASSGRVRLGWCCGVTHAEDEPAFIEIAEALANELRDEVEFLLWGRPSGPLLSRLRAVRAGHRILPMVPWTEIGSAWSQFDVNLIPLAPTPLNACKSGVHWLEPGLLGIPSVASPRGEFTSVIRSGENGFLAASSEEWVRHAAALVRSRELRAEIGARAGSEIAATRTLDQQGPLLRSALEQSLEARVR